MATKSKKAPSATREISTPQAPIAASPRARPPSPIMSSRAQEKQDLANLNDRLAAYIDRVRKLETENSRLTKQIEIHEESVTKEVTSIKSMYETELGDTRKLLDELAKEKAKLQIDAGKYKSELDELKDKFAKTSSDLKDAEKRLLLAEGQITDLQARVTDAVNQKKHAETEQNRLRKEVDSLERQLAVAKKQLEEETISRVDLENRIQSLKEELAFNKQVHQQELSESRMRTQTEYEEVDARLADEYESRLADALQEFRSEMDKAVRSSRGETEAYFVQKLEELRNLAERNDSLKDYAQNESRRLKKEVDELSATVSKLTALNSQHDKRVKDLEDRLRREQEDHHAAIDARDAEVRRLRDALENQLAEYRDLLDVKIQLDTEIAAYRKLLETEESRLSISIESPRGRGTPSRSMTPSVSRKRKRGQLEEGVYSEVAAKHEYTSSSTASGIVEIAEANGEGKFIKVSNNSADKDVSLAGWQVKQTVGETDVVYKFHRTANLKAGQNITIWSADSGVSPNPPSDVVMKGTQKWLTGDTAKSVLINNDGEEVASQEVKRTLLKTTFTRRGEGVSDLVDGREGDPRRDEKCSIM